MTKNSKSSITPAILAILVATAISGAVAWAGAQGGANLWGVPVIVLCAALAFVVQWIAFVPAYARQTEHFFDLLGSLTYLGVTAFALLAAGSTDTRSLVLGGLVLLWAGRLGSFLFRRIRRAGKDARFDGVKSDAGRFLTFWTLQGLWVFLTLGAALAAITTRLPSPVGWLDGVGLVIFVAGFAIEVIADRQKSRFRREHADGFVHTGLWAWSRHPNYFGEIVLWTGVALIAAATLHGWQYVTLISPFFVLFLLTKVSGIPLLEEKADERWGDREDYRHYRDNTPVLVPRPPRRGGSGTG